MACNEALHSALRPVMVSKRFPTRRATMAKGQVKPGKTNKPKRSAKEKKEKKKEKEKAAKK
jgi:hypothetical protein